MRSPDMTGDCGSAWAVTPKGTNWGHNVAFYYVNLPRFHPMLQWFLVITNHLRDVPGMQKAAKNSADCTHEVVIAAIDPETYLFEDVDPDSLNKLSILEPLEVNHQFSGLTDDVMSPLTVGIVTELINGQLPPDRDAIVKWVDYLHYAQKLYKAWIDNGNR